MKKLSIFFAFLLFVGFQATAQMQISGTVTGAEDGLSIPGVSIVVKENPTIGTTTDIDGKYSLTVPSETQVLVFSFVGMATKEETINGRSLIDVVLEADVLEMDEVIVIGYGVRSKKNLISSVSKVDATELQKVSIASVDGALQGNVVGLVVSQNSGAPGQGMSVRVRGVTTVSGSNQPLYVVDGIPIITGNMNDDVYGGQGGNGITNLSPADIQSVEVLKDASAAAIYGARASNGVVLITTKKGKSGDAKIEFRTSYGIQNPINKYEVFTTGQYYEFADLAMYNGGIGNTSYWSWANGWVSDPDLTTGDAELADFYADVVDEPYDVYADMLYRDNAPVWESSLSVSGGNDKTSYYLGVSTFAQEGVLIGQDYNRKSVRFNVDQQATEWLKIFGNVSISKEEVNRINGDNNIFAPTTTAVLEQPGWDVYDENGVFTMDNFRFSNPVQMAYEIDGVSNNFRVLGSAGFRATIIEGLTFNSTFSMDRIDFRERRYYPATTSQGSSTQGQAFMNADTYDRWITSTNLSFLKDYGDLNVNALLAVEYQDYTSTFTNTEANQFPSPMYRWPDSGAEASGYGGSQTENRLFSTIGRVGLIYSDKYLLDASLRADASSKFGADKSTGYFPAVSVGWKVHNEDFLNVDYISELKIKAGYGVTGNESGIGNFAARSAVTSKPYGSNPGVHVNTIGDAGLSWETTSQINAGFDFGLFRDRIHIEYQYFKKKTTDLLLDTPLPGSTGFTTILRNVGEMENSGHEIGIVGRILTGDITWTATFNIGTLKNEVTALYAGPDGNMQPIDYGFVSRVAVGEALGAFYVFQTDGLDEFGDVVYVDNDGDGVITDDDKYFAGKPFPDYSGNFLNTLTYKGIDFSINFQYSQGFEIYNNSNAFGGASGSFVFNKFADQIDYWTEDNTDATLPRPQYGAQQAANNRDSDRFVEDGSYVRLKNITLGYTLPENITKKLTVRIFVGADNLMTWTDYTGLDPEVNAFGAANVATGTDFFTQGLNKTYKFGLNLTF